jgi:hypothetical protein
VSQPVGAPRIHVRAPLAHFRSAILSGMFTTEVQPVRNLIKSALQAQFGYDGVVGVMIAFLHRRPAKHIYPHDTIIVVAATIE